MDDIDRRGLLAGVVGITAAATGAVPPPLAPRPPMGWNSWNSFATTITEAQARDTAAILRDTLIPFGYDTFTVDIQWYEPDAASYEYSRDPAPTMDGYGRLVPAPNRFPSSVGGRGFAPLVADVHAMGLKFGIHLLRGIRRLAVRRNLPVFGTRLRAADIADTTGICSWNPDMYGVDMTTPGAQVRAPHQREILSVNQAGHRQPAASCRGRRARLVGPAGRCRTGPLHRPVQHVRSPAHRRHPPSAISARPVRWRCTTSGRGARSSRPRFASPPRCPRTARACCGFAAEHAHDGSSAERDLSCQTIDDGVARGSWRSAGEYRRPPASRRRAVERISCHHG